MTQHPPQEELLAVGARLHLAALTEKARGLDGVFILPSYNDGEKPQYPHVPNDEHALESLLAICADLRKRKFNTYIAPILWQPNTEKAGAEQDILWVLGDVLDFDDRKAAEYAARSAVKPHVIVETSPDRFQPWYLYDKPVRPDVVRAVHIAHVELAQTDKSGKNLAHVYRVAGSWNRPTATKISQGRSPDPVATKLLECNEVWEEYGTPRELAEAIRRRDPGIFERVKSESATAGKEIDWNARRRPDEPARSRSKKKTRENLGHDDRRSERCFSEINAWLALNNTPQEVFDALSKFSDEPAMGHYAEHTGGLSFDEALRNDIKHAVLKKRKDVPAATYDGDDPIAELNETYAVMCIGGKTFVTKFSDDPILKRRRIDYFPSKQFFDALANQWIADPSDPESGIPLAPYWFRHARRRQYLNGVTLAPLKTVPEGYFNLWRGFSVEPVAGDWSLMKAHIRENICGDDAALCEYLMNWLARLVQQPGTPGEVAVVTRGRKGTGKGKVWTWVGRMMQDHFVHAVHADHVTGKFNGHLQDCVFLFGDESFFAGNPAHEKILNGLITETTRLSEQKFFSAVTVPNYIHLALSTNSDWAIRASADERRYLVLDVGEARMQDTTYFAAIDRQMEAGGLAAMLHELQHRDISKFQVRAVPTTRAMTDQKRLTRQGRSGTLGWIEDVLTAGELGKVSPHSFPLGWDDDGDVWGPKIAANDAYDLYRQWQADHRRGEADNRHVFGRKLREALGATVERKRGPREEFRRQRWFYQFATLNECRLAFAESQRSPGLWEGDDA